MRVPNDFPVYFRGDKRSINRGFTVFAFTAVCVVAFALSGCASSVPTSESNLSEGGSSTVVETSPFFELSSLSASAEGVLSYRLAVVSETPLVLQIAFDGETHAVLFDEDGNTVVGADGHPIDIFIVPDASRESGTQSVSCGTLGKGCTPLAFREGKAPAFGFWRSVSPTFPPMRGISPRDILTTQSIRDSQDPH